MHDYCVFDCFLLNLVTISACELHKVHCCVFDWFLSLLSLFQSVSYMKCMIIVFLTVFSSILSPFQPVSYIESIVIVCFTVFFSILSPFQRVSYMFCL